MCFLKKNCFQCCYGCFLFSLFFVLAKILIFSSQTNEFLRECQGAGFFEGESTRGRSKLNDRERRQAALPILIFGIEMVCL